jgi:hypothetical protein
MTIKDGLDRTLEKAAEREAAELYPRCDDSPPVAEGRWTVKDTLAHLTAWRDYAAAVLNAASTGGDAPNLLGEIDEQNARIYRENRARRADDVRHSARQSWATLRQALSACSEAVLDQPRPKRPELKTWQVVPGNGHEHLAEHLAYLAEERGDQPAAEAAARWSRELTLEAFDDPARLAIADYNFACYFARHAKADEALGLLQSAFGRNPGLKRWAKEDHDLDPIRNRPEITALLL